MSQYDEASLPKDDELRSALRTLANEAAAMDWPVTSAEIIRAARDRRNRLKHGGVLVAVAAAIVIAFIAPIPQLHLFHGSKTSQQANIQHPRSSTPPVTTLTPPASRWQPREVQWLSESSAYVVETRQCGRQTCNRLLLTTDGGLRFSAHPAGVTSGAEGTLRFANLKDVYRLEVSGGSQNSLFQSVDAARTWHEVNFGKATTVYGFTTAGDRVYAIVVSCSSFYHCRDYRLASSVAGSSSWESSPIPGSGGLNGAGVGVGAVGSSVWLTVGNGRPEKLLLSANNGRSFTTVSMGISAVSCAPIPTSPTVVWLTCSTGNFGAWFRSGDSGHSFRHLPVTGANGSTIDPVNDQVAFFDSSPSTILYRTTDGGTTFQKLGALPGAGGLALEVSFGNPSDGLLVSSKTLWRTVDGGTNWGRVSP